MAEGAIEMMPSTPRWQVAAGGEEEEASGGAKEAGVRTTMYTESESSTSAPTKTTKKKRKDSWTGSQAIFLLKSIVLWYRENTLATLLGFQRASQLHHSREIPLDVTRGTPLVDEQTGARYVDNGIKTSRYNLWNFIPLQLWFQFSKVANFYFLVTGILQLIPGLSTTGTFTTILPLLIFLSFSICREGYDDFRRYRLDKVENRRLAKVLYGYRPGGVEGSMEISWEDVFDEWWIMFRRKTIALFSGKPQRSTPSLVTPASSAPWATVKWMNLRVGDIIQLERDEQVPADVLLLYADGREESAFIETMALDGETSLKIKRPVRMLAEQCKDMDDLANCRAQLTVEVPNRDLYSFSGKVTLEGKTMPLTLDNIICRSCILRDTRRAVGIVVNTGEECKIRMNSKQKPKAKAPAMQKITNIIVILLFIFLLLLSLGCSLGYLIWQHVYESKAWYLANARIPMEDISIAFIIEFNNLIPLALYVSMEIVKFGQFLLLQDIEMYDEVSDTPMVANTQTIFENLGQVTHIFSDKTGTLTENKMNLRKISVAGTAWVHGLESASLEMTRGRQDSEVSVPANKKGPVVTISPAVGDDSPSSSRDVLASVEENSGNELSTLSLLKFLQTRPEGELTRKIRFFLLSLAICHTCYPETQTNGEITFQAESPDESALVKAAQELGYLVIDRSTRSIHLSIGPAGSVSAVRETYQVLDVVEFSSTRKRMSIVVRFPDGRICLFCKGADSVIQQRLRLSTLAAQKASVVKQEHDQHVNEEAADHLFRKSFTDGRKSLQRSSMNIGRASLEAGKELFRQTARMSGTFSRSRSRSREPRKSVQQDIAGSYQVLEEKDDIRISVTMDRQAQQSSNLSRIMDAAQAYDDGTIFERCFQHIDEFASDGLRTLLFGYRFIAEKEYTAWKEVYDSATTSLTDRQKMIEAAGEVIEHNFELAGATAIEDKLQYGVPETIEKLQRASVKIWMLTGDKRETAINIAHSTRICKTYSRIIILDERKPSLFTQISTVHMELSLGRIAHSVLVIDGKTLEAVQADDSLAAPFYQLLLLIDSAICCRFTPAQKCGMVKKIRAMIPTSITLAIGDGGNDIAMIQEAHVGIGISGREGLQAARVADYSIAQFRFLQRLLLVHGHWNYDRTAKNILFTFWKEMLFYTIQVLFQRWNGYTGTSLYENDSLTVWNTLFTSLCVILPGIFECDLRAETLLAVPELYAYGQLCKGFNLRKYGWWTLHAVLQALVVWFMIYGLYALVPLVKDEGIFAVGDLAFSVCVVFINTKLLVLQYHHKTWVPLGGCALTIVGWWAWNFFLDRIYSNSPGEVTAYRGFTQHFGTDLLWWAVLLCVLGVLFVEELAVDACKRCWWPSRVEAWQAAEQEVGVRERLRRRIGGGEGGYGWVVGGDEEVRGETGVDDV